MCTRARLVQAGRASPWSSMSHDSSAPAWSTWTVSGGQPTALEVEIDPAAHGPEGIGPLTRGVFLATGTEKDALQFILKANVTAS